PEEAPKDLQLRDRGTGPDPATQATQDFRRDNTTSQLAADNQRRYGPDGTRYGNTPPDQTRVQRLEWQVAELNRQMEALRQAIRPVDPSAPDNDSQADRTGNRVAPTDNNEVSRANEETRPNRPAPAQRQPAIGVAPGDLNEARRQTARQLAVIHSQLDALQRQQRQPLTDPFTEKRLDSLLAQVSRLNARLDAAPAAAANPPQRDAMRKLAPEGTPAENGNTDSGDRDGTGFVASQRGAPDPNSGLDAVARHLEELRRSVDALQIRVAAANLTETTRKRLPYGPLVIYYRPDAAVMGPDDRQRLDVLVKGLGADSSAVVQIKGFADQTGNPAYNMALSRRRANNVRKYLVDALGMKPGQIIINYFGQAMATQEKKNPYDRRVELEIYVAGE
ncbi:MAG: OmpA family protein, partial [Cytophagales bacterium]|nr:OmpA family protein [Cytophagales bacterium]